MMEKVLLLSSSPKISSIVLGFWFKCLNYYKLFKSYKVQNLMRTCQYKNFVNRLWLLSRKTSQQTIYHNGEIQGKANTPKQHSCQILSKSYFGSKKNQKPQAKVPKLSETDNTVSQQAQYLWKFNLLFNLFGIGAGLFFPKETLLFVLTSNSMVQVYQSSRLISDLKDFAEKGSSQNNLQENGMVKLKSLLKKIVTNTGILLGFSVSSGLGVIDPSYTQYSLIGLNFWILYNLKFNRLSHGYYVILLSLLGFQCLYFLKTSESNDESQLPKRI